METVPDSSLPTDDRKAAAVDHRAVRIAVAALVVGALALGFSPILVRLSELGPTATGFHRVFLALPALWVWTVLASRRAAPEPDPRPVGRRDFALMALAGVFFAGDLGFWHWSLQFTSVANSTLLANFAPIFVTVGAFVIFGERVSRTFMVGMALAFLGAGVLMGESFAFNLTNLFGDALGVITAMFLGAYILTVGRLRARVSTAVIMLCSSAVTAIVLLPLTVIGGEGLIAATAWGWTVLVGLALIAHAGGQGLFAYALAHLPVAFSSVGLLLEPVAAAVLAWIILGEDLSGWQGVGAIAVLAGILLARRGSREAMGS